MSIPLDRLLTPHFTFGEMSRTDVRFLLDANRAWCEERLRPLTATAELFELVRLLLDAPIIMHSGGRCEQLNRHIGGAPNSQHMLCEAGDFHVLGVPLRQAFDEIRRSTIKWGQLILECDEWIHLSLGSPWRPKEKCQQVLYFDGKRYSEIPQERNETP
jgi:zinc D-Ala-D-Ala carboxypeptidase